MPDTDWHVEKLYVFAADHGVDADVRDPVPHVVDLNRDPSGAALYAGADNTEVCPPRTFADAPVYGTESCSRPKNRERIAAYFPPYHARLAAEIGRVRARHGYAVLLTGIRSAARCRAFSRAGCPISISAPPTARVARRRCRRARPRCWPAPPASRTS